MKRSLIVLLSVLVLLILIILWLSSVCVIPPDAMTHTAITESFVRMQMYMKDHHQFPASLNELPERSGYANRTTDGWQRPLIYEVEQDNFVTLLSYGKDGKQGGTGNNTDIQRTYRTKNNDGSWCVDEEGWIVTAEVKETLTQLSLTLLSADEAKAVFEQIDSGLEFTSISNEYLGTTDHLYYADVMKPTSQVTVNIGKREDTKKPMANLYVSISALKPLDEAIEKEISTLIEKYINGFLMEAFPNGEELSKQCALPINSSSIGKAYETETSTCTIECSTSKGHGNPEYMSYLLRITENTFQKELNQRIMGNSGVVQ